MPSKQVFLALGSNLGERRQNLEAALVALQHESIQLTACSSLYETEPRDVAKQPWFLNMVACGQTKLFPLQLLAVLHRIERQLGRKRLGAVPRGPRLIDIDILLFGSLAMATEELTIPHPRMLERRFVLEPLVEIAPVLRDPVTGELLAKRLSQLADQRVRKIGAVSAGFCSDRPI